MSKKKLVYVLLLLIWAEFFSFAALNIVSKKYPLLVYKQGDYDIKKVANNLDDELGWGGNYVQLSNSKASSCRLLLFGDSFLVLLVCVRVCQVCVYMYSGTCQKGKEGKQVGL